MNMFCAAATLRSLAPPLAKRLVSVLSGRSGIKILTDAAYLSPAGLVVIVVLGALFVLCYCALATRRSHAHYSGQPMYGSGYGGGAYGGGYNNGYGSGGGGLGGGGLCAACLAGFCCTELCCTGNINF
jgi:hypothetical protein